MQHTIPATMKLTSAAQFLVAKANESGQEASGKFWDTVLVANPGDSPDALVAFYRSEEQRKHQEAVAANPIPHDERLQRRKAEQREKERALETALAQAPERMSLRTEEGWAEAFAAISADPEDPRMMAIQWARLMEAQLAVGETVKDCAKRTLALVEAPRPMSPFAYGAAVGFLKRFWVHGNQRLPA